MAAVLVHSPLVERKPDPSFRPSLGTASAPGLSVGITQQTVHDLFSMLQGPTVDPETARGFLESAKEITCLKIPAHLTLAAGVMQVFADTLPNLEELSLPSKGKRLNEVSDAQILSLAQKCPGLRKLTLNQISKVTAEGFSKAFSLLHNLQEFSTNYPLNDDNLTTILSANPNLTKLALSNRTKLSAAMIARLEKASS